MKRRDLIIFLLFATVLFGTMFTINAVAEDTTTDAQSEVDSQVEENASDIAAYEKKKQAELAALAKAEDTYEQMLEDSKILRTDFEKINDQIDGINAEIKAMDEQLKKSEEQHKKKMELMKKRIATMYIKQNSHYADLFLSADSLVDFIEKSFIYDYVVSQDNKLLEELKRDMQLYKDNKKLQDEIKIALDIKQDAMSDDKEKWDSEEAEIKEKIEDNKATIAYYTKQQQILEQQSNDIQEYLANNQNNAGDYVGGTMVWPCKGYIKISSYYGMRTLNGVTSMHKGLDIAASSGVSIEAANSGTILSKTYGSTGYGYYIVIGHGGGKATLYGHCSSLSSKAVGASVVKGETIARIGSTGNSTGPHCHFEVREYGVQVNPLNYVSAP